MRWRWWPCRCESAAVTRARREADRAEDELAEIRQQRAEAFALAEKGREQRQRNHFGESLDHAFQRRRHA